MLIQILSGTPRWVFVLFFVLIALGIQQSRPRRLSPGRIALLPAVFLALSLFSAASAFGPSPAVFAAWLAGIAASVLANRALKSPAGVRWDEAAGAFFVPGSWIPLGLMMTVFFARYAIAVSLAMHPALLHGGAYAASAGFVYGLLSGAFLARALRIWSQRPARAVHSVQST